MAINKVVYDGNTLIDLTDLNVSADKLAKDVKAIDKTGTKIIGTMVASENLDVELNQYTNELQSQEITIDDIKEALKGKASGGGSSSGGSNAKYEFQTYTPASDEISHTFSHNLGVVPDYIMIYWGELPTFYGAKSTPYTLLNAWGFRSNGAISNNLSRYSREGFSVSQNNNDYSPSQSEVSLDNGIENSDYNGVSFLYKATENSFEFFGGRYNSSHLGAGLTYHIVLIGGLFE